MSCVSEIQKKEIILSEGINKAVFCDDAYSDRVRCDHPRDVDALWLAEKLIVEAEKRKRGKIMTLVGEKMILPMQRAGFRVAGYIQGFYEGKESCGVLTLNRDTTRLQLANPKEVSRVYGLLRNVDGSAQIDEKSVEPELRIMREADVVDVARLMGKTFKEYPTPSDDPAFLLEQHRSGVPFRFIRNRGSVVACASADLIEEARTAELTDCATLPEFRGRGYMKLILQELIEDLRVKKYPTAFTMARARIPGINIVFKQLGFQFCGQVARSCRIGEGLEDINLWSRRI